MPYATKQNMIDRFNEREVIALTDRIDAGVVDDAVLNAALADADAEINPYLEGRVALPLTTVPVILRGYACDIARYRLTGSGVMETDIIRKRYDDAIAFLKAFAAGKVSLGLDNLNQQAPAPSGGAVKFSNAGTIFSRENTVDS